MSLLKYLTIRLQSRFLQSSRRFTQFSHSNGTFRCRHRDQFPLFRRALPPTTSKQFCFVHSVSVGRRANQSFGCGSFKNYCGVLKESKLEMPERKQFKRLPTSVKPKHYVLTLTPDLKTFSFRGEVSIQIEVLQEEQEIILNAVDIDTKKVTLQSSASNLSVPDKIDLSKDDETLRLGFKEPIAAGTYDLNIIFNGELNDQLRGLYRSKYTSESGEERYAAVTQFEATDARRCFPCWDEPALKATFDISLIVPPKLVALSNMPVKNESAVEDLVRYDFETTPIMSTYLVAVVVGEYDYIEDRSEDGVLVRVYTPKGKKEQGRFALEVATKVLPYYKEYFNIAYPLPKIDLIAIADFSAGAMENWGLVTYRERCLLVDPKDTSAVHKQWVALVVGHELAHQWFGNLVTMEWWTHLWLNEGYASFVEFLCVNHLFPEYDIWTQFVTETFIRALELDSLQSSHPIEVPVGHPSEIDEIFDDISYNKGAAVIRMLHHYIGDEDFRKGMNLYLTRHQYKNTFTEDLWAALGEASSKPVGAVMSTWTKQMGFPVVKVVAKAAGTKGVTLTLSQSKFCADGVQPKEDYMWMIPISVSTAKDPKREAANVLLNGRSCELTLSEVDPSDWIKLNPGTVGFYRTQYTPEMLERLVPAIQDRSLPPLDRLGLLDDLFALVQAGHTSTTEALKLMRAFEDEVNFTVWCSICNVLSKLRVLLSYSDCDQLFKNYEKQLLSKVSKRLGWNAQPNETHLDTLLRSLILSRLAWLDDEEATKEAKLRFDQHVGEGPTLSADLRGACYKLVLRAEGKPMYDALMKLYRSTDLHEEKDRISKSLGAAKDPEILVDVLKFATSEDVRSQDMVVVIMSVAITREGRDLAWAFMKKNWDSIIRCQGSYLLTRLVKICENFADNRTADEIERFFTEKNSPGTERAVRQSVENVRLNAAWLKRDAAAIKTYLTKNNY